MSISVSEMVQHTSDLNRYQQVNDDSSVLWLEKAQAGKVSVADIKDALDEFSKLFKVGLASKAEILTLARAFPDSSTYAQAAKKQSEENEDDPIVIGGPASVSLVDREGHLITTGALDRAFKKFMGNIRTRNTMVLHSDVQIGWALPAYISKGGQIFKSGVDDKGLFFICELRDDTAIAKKVAEQINKGMLKSYSIAGSATKVQNINKGLVPYLQVDDMELAEVTVCEKGVNQGAGFELLKAEIPQIDRIEAPKPQVTERIVIMHSKDDGTVDFARSFSSWMQKEHEEGHKDPLKTKESFATLHNEEGRRAEHQQLLREYGFPSEQPMESMRYVPVVETETDDDGIPVHNLPPWVVNEAGEALGDRLDEDSPGYKKSAKAKARQKAGSAQKMFYDFMDIKKAPMSERERELDRVRPREEGDGESSDREKRNFAPPGKTRRESTKFSSSPPDESDRFQRQVPTKERNGFDPGTGRPREPSEFTRGKPEEPKPRAIDRMKQMFGGAAGRAKQSLGDLGEAGKGIGRAAMGTLRRGAGAAQRAGTGFRSGARGEAPYQPSETGQVGEAGRAGQRIGQLFRTGKEKGTRGGRGLAGAGLRGGRAAAGAGLRGGRAVGRGAGEALSGAAEGYRSYDPKTDRYQSFTGPRDRGDIASGDRKPSTARSIGRLFGQVGRGSKESIQEGGRVAGLEAGRFSRGVARGARPGRAAEQQRLRERYGPTAWADSSGNIMPGGDRPKRSASERAGQVLGQFGRKRTADVLRESGRGARGFGRGIVGKRSQEEYGQGPKSLTEAFGRRMGEATRGGGRISRKGAGKARTGTGATARFIGEHAPKVGAGARRGRAEEAVNQRNIDTTHALHGIGEGKVYSHPKYRDMAHHERRAEAIRTHAKPVKTLNDHLSLLEHLVGSNATTGDNIMHMTVGSLPEGIHHGTEMDNNQFMDLYDKGHIQFRPTAEGSAVDTATHEAEVTDRYRQPNNPLKSLPAPTGQVGGQGGGQIGGQGGGQPSPSGEAGPAPTGGWGAPTGQYKTGYDKIGVNPAYQGMALDKMFQKAFRLRTRTYPNTWKNNHVNK